MKKNTILAQIMKLIFLSNSEREYTHFTNTRVDLPAC